jgi:PAS domain S-box-containing protein
VEARDRELEERRRIEKLLASQKRVLESAALGAPVEETLNLLISEVEEAIPGAMCSISMQVDNLLHRIAGPSLPEEYRKAVDNIVIGADPVAYGRAAYQRDLVVAEDIARDDNWKDYREIALKNGLRACWALPVLAPNGGVLGTLALYFAAPRLPLSSETETIDLAARLIGIIIERARTVQALRDSEEFNRLLLESSPDCVKVLDTEGHLSSMNGPGLSIMEIDDFEPLRGKKWAQTWAEPQRSKAEAALAAALQGKTEAFQAMCPTAKGTMKCWDVIVTPVRNGAGNIVSLLVTSRDVTEARRQEEEREQLLNSEQAARAEAEAANRAKDEFIATLSHELRTPLAAISGWSSLLKQGGLDEQTTQHGYDVIHRNAQAQNQIIEDILDISRIVTGKMNIEPQPLRLESVLEAARDAVKLAADNKRVALNLHLPDNAAKTMIQGDAARLQQVFWNLLNNAVKFTPTEGTIEVQMRLEQGWAVVDVRDSGQGIAPEFLPYVFDRFRQADGSTTRKHSGLGLGLSIVRYIVEAHGGTVHAQSDGKGRGAVFTVQLPLAEATPKTNNITPSAGRSLLGRNIIVVEDEKDVRELIELILRQQGAQVRGASSVVEALSLIEQGAPDILVTDIGMPEMDGIELMTILQQRYQNQLPFRVVALTAYAGEGQRQSVMNAGFDSFLAKPIAPRELTEALAFE